MLLGAWGRTPIDLLETAAEGAGTALDRAGSARVVGAPGATEGGWRCWVSGRITNIDELWRRFPGRGRVDLSATIARAHATVGPSACELLRGTFVLVAVDLERDRALISRDHLGGRPLTYMRLEGGALFAEHERDILDLLPSTPGPDRLALQQWVEKGTVPGGRTLYEGVSRLPPAHRLELSAAGIAVERYWAPRYEGTVPGSRQEVADRLRAEAFAAVDRAASGSRRTAVRLSGGLDSACVAAGLAARGKASSEALALSAVFRNQPETDERELIDATARYTGLAVRQVEFDEGASILLPALRHIRRWRLPPESPNLVVWDPVMAMARSLKVDAMLDGEGGDELFGMAPYLIADMLRSGRLDKAWALTGGIPGMGESPDRRLRLRALRVFGVSGLVPPSARRWRRRRRETQVFDSLLPAHDLATLVDLEDDSRGRGLDGPYWWRALAADLIGGGDEIDVAGHLRREALEGGVDRRHPFLFDRDLVDAVLANPPSLQFDPSRDRALLRDALAGYIPEEVRQRYSKSHFTPILVKALAGADGELLTGALADRDAPIRSYLSSGALDRMLERSDTGNEMKAARRLWQVGMADTWLRVNERPEYVGEVLEKAT